MTLIIYLGNIFRVALNDLSHGSGLPRWKRKGIGSGEGGAIQID